MPTRDDDDFETSPGRQPLPEGWVSVGPNLLLRVDGMRLTTPNSSLWDLELLGDCPFVVEVQRETDRGPVCAQRSLMCSRLEEACEEANKRFPIPGWFMESDTGPRQRLDTEAKDEGWVVVPRRRAVMVEGIEMEDPDAVVGYGYIAGTRPWSPGAMQVEIDRAAERRALKKALAQRRGR